MTQQQGNTFWRFTFIKSDGMYRNLHGTMDISPGATALEQYEAVIGFLVRHAPELKGQPIISHTITPNFPGGAR